MKILDKNEQINKRCYEIDEIVKIAVKEKDTIDSQYSFERKKWFKNRIAIDYLRDRSEKMNKVILTLIDYKNELKEQLTL